MLVTRPKPKKKIQDLQQFSGLAATKNKVRRGRNHVTGAVLRSSNSMKRLDSGEYDENEEQRITHITWEGYKRRIDEGDCLIIPMGAVEQHSTHLPLGVDCLIVEAIAKDVVKECKGTAMLAPTLSYGYKSQTNSGGGQSFPGTTSLDGTTAIAMVRDIVRETRKHGCKRIVIINGHYENTYFQTEGIDMAIRDLEMLGMGDVAVMRLDYWDFATDAVLKEVFGPDFVGWAAEHAGLLETVLMMHYYPETVDLSHAPKGNFKAVHKYVTFPHKREDVPEHGALSSCAGATKKKGARLSKTFVHQIAAVLMKEFGYNKLFENIAKEFEKDFEEIIAEDKRQEEAEMKRHKEHEKRRHEEEKADREEEELTKKKKEVVAKKKKEVVAKKKKSGKAATKKKVAKGKGPSVDSE